MPPPVRSHPAVDLWGARQTGTLRPGCVLSCLRRRGGTAGQRPREAPQVSPAHWGPGRGLACLRGPAFAVSGVSLEAPICLHRNTHVCFYFWKLHGERVSGAGEAWRAAGDLQ